MKSLDDTGDPVSKVERNDDSFDLKRDDQKSTTDGMLNGQAVASVDEIDVVVSVDVSLDAENERDTKVICTAGEAIGDDEYMNLNLTANGREQGSDEILENSDHEFKTGDFVWGKIKSHPWWPGQIYDSDNASEAAIKHRRDGCFLVAFFGDDSWSWCAPAQLIPFTENFNEKSMSSSSKIFLKAVQDAVVEVSKNLESKMTCSCVSVNRRKTLAKRITSNSGAKVGVPIPDADIQRLSIPYYAAAEVLAKVNSVAITLSVDNLLELAALRGWLAAMFYAKGERQLPEYHDYDVEGLEDVNGTATEVTDDFSVPIEVPILGPSDEDWHSSPAVDDVMTQEAMADKIYHRRKQKSVADLMREDNGVKVRSRKKPFLNERKDSKNSSSVEGKGGVGPSKKGRRERGSSKVKSGSKRKLEVSESPDVITGEASKPGDVDLCIEVGAEEGGLAGKPNGISVASVENDSSKTIEGSENASTPRERKVSKYLSPPYISPGWGVGSSSFKLEAESGKSPRKDEQNQEDHEFLVSETPSASHQDVANSSSNEKQHGNDVIHQNKYVSLGPSSELDVGKLSFSPSDVVTPVNEMLAGIQTAAVDPMYLSREGTLDAVYAFTSALRKSTYVHGVNDEIHQKQMSIKRRKSLRLLGVEEEKLAAKRPKLASVRSPKTNTSGRQPGPCRHEKSAETSGGLMKATSAESAPNKLNDDFMSDIQLTRQKFDIMVAILENYQLKFSLAEKRSLKDEMRLLMESVEAASDKVRVLAERHKQVS